MTSPRQPHEDISRNAQVIEQFRTQGNDRLLLLTTTGRKSGRSLTTPLQFMGDGDRVVVAASNHGYDQHPGWYYNLVAEPNVTVEIGSERYEATAAVVQGAERERLLEMAKTGLPFVAEYQAKTSRRIELVALERDG
ncbi:MAG TPA: nitroreductase/quinone reductase family protein [Candidatus Limnocylindrales bacterium]|nr:nitroreductase/quinone reductase family protein [Candidatus Limnocylindrales bacterium]